MSQLVVKVSKYYIDNRISLAPSHPVQFYTVKNSINSEKTVKNAVFPHGTWDEDASISQSTYDDLARATVLSRPTRPSTMLVPLISRVPATRKAFCRLFTNKGHDDGEQNGRGRG